VHRTLGKALAVGAATLALVTSLVAAAAAASTPTMTTATTIAGAEGRAGAPGPARPPHSPRHVILAGIGGLRWSDVSADTTPALWHVASEGSVGSLVVSGIYPLTCPADGWLTMNAGARATVPHPAAGPCPPAPAVTVGQVRPGSGQPGPALVTTMPALVRDNAQYHYNPRWGLLASASGGLPAAPPGPGNCATAAGPGAALALAGPAGRVASYLPSPSMLTPAILTRCRLTVADLGNLPSAPGAAGHRARAMALRSADQQLGRISAALPSDSALIVFASGDGSQPGLRAVMVSGPGYGRGLLASASTHRQGMVLLVDLTATVLDRLGRPAPPAVVGLPLTATPRPATLSATLGLLAGQDTAARVYRQTVTPFFQVVGFGYPALFALIWVIPWGRGARRRPRRRALARTVGLWAASVPVGTFLASAVPWWAMPHPALALYGLAVAWAALVAGIALAGPWRRDPLGPPGMVAAVTLGVIGLDLVTGSHLGLETPFGFGVLEAGRFYGLANNAVVSYGAAGILCAAWLGGAALRRDRRRRALLSMAAVAVCTVMVAAWPGFGAKVGGTIALVPAFLVLLAAAAKVRITPWRAALAAVSGVALVALVALITYLVPVTGHSDIGGFVGQALHGGAGATVQRKISSNLGSLTANPFIPVIPVLLVVLGVVIAWPARLRCTLLVRACQQIPLLRAALSAVWLMAVLGWFAEDSGVTVPAAGLPLVLPLMVVILSSVRAADDAPATQVTLEGTGNGPVIVRKASGVAPDRAGWRIE
jgi:peptidoglycan/LPS O-acetylase OafA/YrhL